MDMMSIVSAMLAAQAGNTQTQVGVSVLKSSIDAEKSVLTLLGAAQPGAPSLGNVGPGIGGMVNIAA
jgi:hypothetical protein